MKISMALLAALGCSLALANPPAATDPAMAAASHPAAAPLSKGEIKAMQQFKMLDFNGDGRLSRSEVALFPPLSAAFDDTDTDHDNLVSYAEVRVLLPNTAPNASASGPRKPNLTRVPLRPSLPKNCAPSEMCPERWNIKRQKLLIQ